MREREVEADLIDVGAVTVETKGGGNQLPLDEQIQRQFVGGLSAD